VDQIYLKKKLYLTEHVDFFPKHCSTTTIYMSFTLNYKYYGDYLKYMGACAFGFLQILHLFI
jgi:hypothetical protein